MLIEIMVKEFKLCPHNPNKYEPQRWQNVDILFSFILVRRHCWYFLMSGRKNLENVTVT